MDSTFVKGKSLLSMNFLCSHLSKFVFVETTALLLTISESNFQCALYRKVKYMNNSQNQALKSYSQIEDAFFLVVAVLISTNIF